MTGFGIVGHPDDIPAALRADPFQFLGRSHGSGGLKLKTNS
jgi:hypothetical protein